MYVKEFLQFVASTYQLSNITQKVKEMIDITGLGIEQNKKISQLSKGYRQRVGLAQAMIHNPSVLILDEPTSGLDPNQIVEIRNLIKTIGKDKTVMLSTHIMQEVEAMCNRVIIINKGIIVANGNPSELKSHLNNRIQVSVTFSKSIPPTLVSELQKLGDIMSENGDTFVIESALEENTLKEQLFQFAVQNQLFIHELKLMENTLEDLFKNVTNP
jgi:ABC-2 type transport system ATP-binding protein